TDGSVKKSKQPDSFFTSNIATISLTSGLGGEYKLTDKASLRCNILYSQNLLPLNSDPIRLHLQWLALNVGYNYRLK
ncbi:MAG TPA: hypothetical protein VEC12_07195, partial [Bacteroidia bacterium]|nr:hypothetical protein [Bacteroidia bacterium]